MRLYFQLSDEEKIAITNHCFNQVVSDIISGLLSIDPQTDADFVLFDELEQAMHHLEALSSKEDKIEYLMSRETIASAINELANDMARNFLFLEDDENTIYASALLPKVEAKKLLGGVESASSSTTDVDDGEFEDDGFLDYKNNKIKDPYSLN